MHLSHYVAASPPFTDPTDGLERVVVFATRTASLRVVEAAHWRAIAAGDLATIPHELADDLASIELLVSEDDELTTVLGRNRAAVHAERGLYMVVQPTAWCQLACDYCGQEHSPVQLAADHQRRFLERARSKLFTNDFSIFRIGWFGAEPLAGLPVIRSLTPQLIALADEFAIGYGAKMVTNGVALDHDLATELVTDHRIDHIEITLDGLAEHHDARRITKKGAPTFERIFANLLDLARREDIAPRISVRCNVDRRNHDAVEPLLERIANEGIQRRIAFYIAPIHDWGNDADRLALDKQRLADLDIIWSARMVELGFAVGVLPALKPVVCMAVSRHAELVDARGTLFNCSEVSYVPAYGEPNRYALGSLVAGVDERKRAAGFATFNDRIAARSYDCSSCRMLPVCGGACPKAWQDGRPPCPLAKFNIEQRLLVHVAASMRRHIDALLPQLTSSAAAAGA